EERRRGLGAEPAESAEPAEPPSLTGSSMSTTGGSRNERGTSLRRLALRWGLGTSLTPGHVRLDRLDRRTGSLSVITPGLRCVVGASSVPAAWTAPLIGPQGALTPCRIAAWAASAERGEATRPRVAATRPSTTT